ncbi:hypothetical protein D3C81_1163770 [compost metagenome]
MALGHLAAFVDQDVDNRPVHRCLEGAGADTGLAGNLRLGAIHELQTARSGKQPETPGLQAISVALANAFDFQGGPASVAVDDLQFEAALGDLNA